MARETHVLARSIGAEGEAKGGLKGPVSVAVNDSTHDVYIADPGNHRVDEFTEGGEFVLMFGREVNANALAKDRNVCTALETCQAGVPGSSPGQFETPAFVAVDNAAGGEGDLYVADTADNTITKLTSEGIPIKGWGVEGQITGTPTGEGSTQIPFGPLAGITIDTTGTLDAIDVHNLVSELERNSTFHTQFEAQTPFGIAEPRGLTVDAAGDFFEVDLDSAVEEFGPEGADIGQVTMLNHVEHGGVEFVVGAVAGLAFDPNSEELFVVEGEEHVRFFNERVGRYVFNGSGEVVEPKEPGEPGETEDCVVEPNPEHEDGKGCRPLDAFGAGTLVEGRGVGVDPSGAATVYVADASADHVGVYVPVTLPDVQTLAASELRPHTAALNGKVNPDGIPLTECEFEYVDAAGYRPEAVDPYAGGAKAACVPGAGEIAGETEVHADVAGLEADTVYHYRLEAANSKGAGTGKDESFTTTGAGIESESAGDVTNDSAELQASIEPNNAPASYRFEYVEAARYQPAAEDPYAAGASTPVGSIAAGNAPVEVAQAVQGLRADIEYHYRVVVVSELGFGDVEFAGADHNFTTRTPGEFRLPDDRQWQMVSPPQKQGVELEPIKAGWVIKAAAGGGAVTYVADAPSETEPAGYSNFVQVFSARGPGGWRTRDLTLPHSTFTNLSIGNGQEYRFFSEDLSRAVAQPFGPFLPCTDEQGDPQPCVSPEASEQTAFVQDTGSGVFTPLVTGCPASGPCPTAVREHANVTAGTVFGGDGECGASSPCGPGFDGASPDLGHVVFTASDLTSMATPAGALYEWSARESGMGQLHLVSLLPPNEAGEVLPAGNPSLGGGNSLIERGAVSGDGSRVVWSSGGNLYLRENATGPGGEGECTVVGDGCTAQVDAGLTGNAEFQAASSNGARVFFTDGGVLYEFEVGHASASVLASGLMGPIAGISEDGSTVYFVSEDTLAGAKPGPRGEVPQAGQPNLYVVSGGVARLVATLADADAGDWDNSGLAGLNSLTVRVSSDGGWLAFMSGRGLTGYDNRDAVSGELDEEVFLYHAPGDLASGAGTLVCASCDPSGARPHGVEYGVEGKVQPAMPLAGGNRVWPETTWLAGNVPGWTPYAKEEANYQSRFLSDGGRLFFNASDGLVPEDVNGVGDVYEYEPAGVGPSGAVCGPGVAGGGEVFEREREVGVGVVDPAGCVALISSGASAQESGFLDASETGSDVFFLTSGKLVSGDTDTALDVYDAHECSSVSPCLPGAVSVSPACDTEASCKAAPSPQPGVFGLPSSATFSGPGNVAPVPPAAAVVHHLTRAQERAAKLRKALKACGKDKRRVKRRACERAAHKKYGPKPAKKASNASNKGRS